MMSIQMENCTLELTPLQNVEVLKFLVMSLGINFCSQLRKIYKQNNLLKILILLKLNLDASKSMKKLEAFNNILNYRTRAIKGHS